MRILFLCVVLGVCSQTLASRQSHRTDSSAPLFETCDLNNDQRIDQHEFNQLCLSLYDSVRVPPKVLLKLFHMLTFSHRDYIGQDEFRKIWHRWIDPQLNPKTVLFVFQNHTRLDGSLHSKLRTLTNFKLMDRVYSVSKDRAQSIHHGQVVNNDVDLNQHIQSLADKNSEYIYNFRYLTNLSSDTSIVFIAGCQRLDGSPNLDEITDKLVNQGNPVIMIEDAIDHYPVDQNRVASIRYRQILPAMKGELRFIQNGVILANKLYQQYNQAYN